MSSMAWISNTEAYIVDRVPLTSLTSITAHLYTALRSLGIVPWKLNPSSVAVASHSQCIQTPTHFTEIGIAQCLVQIRTAQIKCCNLVTYGCCYRFLVTYYHRTNTTYLPTFVLCVTQPTINWTRWNVYSFATMKNRKFILAHTGQLL